MTREPYERGGRDDIAVTRKSGTTKFHRTPNFPELLDRASHGDYEVADISRARFKKTDAKQRKLRYQHRAIGVALYYSLNSDERRWSDFAAAFQKRIGRPLKSKSRLREVFVFTDGDIVSSHAGTDAKALLQPVVREKILAAALPNYIRENGGLDALLRKERERDGSRRQATSKDRHSAPTTMRVVVPDEKVGELTKITVGAIIWMQVAARPGKGDQVSFLLNRIKVSAPRTSR